MARMGTIVAAVVWIIVGIICLFVVGAIIYLICIGLKEVWEFFSDLFKGNSGGWNDY
jgi:hypothetical protein